MSPLSILAIRDKQQLYNKLCNLRLGIQIVQQYRETFYNQSARNEVVESNDKLVARYLIGLRADLQANLQGFYFLTVEKIVLKAEAFENQALRTTHIFQNSQKDSTYLKILASDPYKSSNIAYVFYELWVSFL